MHLGGGGSWPITAAELSLTWTCQALQDSASSRSGKSPSITTTVDTPLTVPPPRSGPASYHHVGSISTAYGAHSRRRGSQCCQQDSFGTTPRTSHLSRQLPQAPTTLSKASSHPKEAFTSALNYWLTHWVIQRSASSSSSSAEGAASSWKNNALPAGATVFAIGSIAWYCHLYGRNVDAMTPAEEG